MARNQRGRGLDLATRNHLSALDAFIEQQAEVNKPIQPDEFTINSYIQKMKLKGVALSGGTANRTLQELVKSGVLSVRRGVDKRSINIYKFI